MVINKGKKIFYSIVIPAHNEEKYISNTLKHLLNLKYPKDKYGVIVVENGSKDKTYGVAKKFSSKKVKVYSLKKPGVSNAKNFGATKASKKVKWFIFLDADCSLKKNFLNDVNSFLCNTKENEYSAGACRARPIEKTWKLRLFLWYYGYHLRVFRASISVQFINKNFFKKVKFDPDLSLGEDYYLLKQLRKYGKFFFINTKEFEISTRRFKRFGLLKVIWVWLHGGLLSNKSLRKINYEVVR